MIERLHLVRVGLYPEVIGEHAMVLDYTISRDITDYLLVVKCDSEGTVAEVEMES